MSNNLHKAQNIFIADGTALPANDATTVAGMTAGKIGIYGQDMLALDPAGTDTITTQPYIYIMEAKTDSNGVGYLKRSPRIDGANVINYTAKKYAASKREVWAIGHNRATAVGTIEVNNSTDYTFTIRFKNDKQLYSERPEVLNVTFTSAAAATQLSIATQIAASINNSSYKTEIKAVVIGDGTGVYGLTGATDYGVEIWGLNINQNLSTTYTQNIVYFAVFVNDATGFGTTSTCAQIQAFTPGVGTYNEVYAIENFDLAYEGAINRRRWLIPSYDYSSTSTMISSTLIGINTTGTSGEDTVTFATTIAAILSPGDKVEINGVNYEIKFIKGTGTGVTAANAVVLTTPLLTSPGTADLTKLRVKYDLINIEYNDAINTPTGVVAIANKSVVIAVPAITSGGAYNTQSQSGTDVKAILDAWMATTPRAFANITI